MRVFCIPFVCFIFLLDYSLFAQELQSEEHESGGALNSLSNSAENPCISLEQYRQIERRCVENSKSLHLDDRILGSISSTLFQWPLQQAPGFHDCSYYSIVNYVDEDSTSGILDYNCGKATYDGHRGIDIAIMPFPFLKMDTNAVQIIAAAPGVIIDKADGNFDKNCAMNSNPANYVIVQHSDGSVALYWHMKKTTVTKKKVGDAVVLGEVLGNVGSSGSSTGPHLHFEVWKTTSPSSLQETYSGDCNRFNKNSWWATQKPYTEPAIVKVSTNDSLIGLPPCPQTETPHEGSVFKTGATSVKFTIFLRNETPGINAAMRILNAAGVQQANWAHNPNTSYGQSYWYWNRTLNMPAGKYTFEASYNGDTCRSSFTLTTSESIDQNTDASTVHVYSSELDGNIHVLLPEIPQSNDVLELSDLLGRNVLRQNLNQQCTVIPTTLKQGVYAYRIVIGGIVKTGLLSQSIE